MQISVKKRFVFISNTKNASTSIETALLPFCEIVRGGTSNRKHIWMADALQEYAFLFERPGFEPETFFKFGVMRDPVEWIVSWYRYRKGNKVDAPLPAHMTFAQFWEMGDWNKIIQPTGEKRLQSQFFTGKDGKLLMDFIIPYETLAQAFPIIARSLGIYTALPFENVSILRKDAVDVPGWLIPELRAFYAEDYALIADLPRINETGLKRLTATRQISA
jgi:hypothetical protein